MTMNHSTHLSKHSHISFLPAVPSLPNTSQIEVWLSQHNLTQLLPPLQEAGYDDLEDLKELVLSPEAVPLLESMIAAPGHRAKLKRLLRGDRAQSHEPMESSVSREQPESTALTDPGTPVHRPGHIANRR
eukprot:Sspe_Gene.75188::Locus_46990_Transcript_1_1_Confidence_1.000_Length_449::g.75188::m.75188